MTVARAQHLTRVLVLGPVPVLGHVSGRHVGPGRPGLATVLPHRAHRLPRPAGPGSAHVPPHPARRVPRAASQNHHGVPRPPGWNGRVPRHRAEAALCPSRLRGSRRGLNRRCPNQRLRGPNCHRSGPNQHRRGLNSHRSGPNQHRRGPNPHHRGPKYLRGPNFHLAGPSRRPRGPVALRPGQSHQGCCWSRCAQPRPRHGRHGVVALPPPLLHLPGVSPGSPASQQAASQQKAGAASSGSGPSKVCPAASYSPTRSPAQYHRR